QVVRGRVGAHAEIVEVRYWMPIAGDADHAEGLAGHLQGTPDRIRTAEQLRGQRCADHRQRLPGSLLVRGPGAAATERHLECRKERRVSEPHEISRPPASVPGRDPAESVSQTDPLGAPACLAEARKCREGNEAGIAVRPNTRRGDVQQPLAAIGDGVSRKCMHQRIGRHENADARADDQRGQRDVPGMLPAIAPRQPQVVPGQRQAGLPGWHRDYAAAGVDRISRVPRKTSRYATLAFSELKYRSSSCWVESQYGQVPMRAGVTRTTQ